MRQLIHLIFLLSCFAWFTGCETPQSGSGSASTGGGADSFQVQDNPLLTNVSRGEDVGKNLNRLMEGPTVDHCPNCPIPDSQPEASGARVNDSTLMSNYTKLGGDPVALEQALCFANKYKRTKFKTSGEGYSNGIGIDNQRYITINDLNKSSNEKRLFILDTQTGQVSVYQSGHGSGTKGGKSNSKERSTHFSNTDGTSLTPSGFFITGNKYTSTKEWGTGMRLHGLQPGINDNSMARGIVLHKAPYVAAGVARSSDSSVKIGGSTAGRSNGCTAVSPSHVGEIMGKLASGTEGRHPYRGGSLYYNYSPAEKNKGRSYCGNPVGTK